MRTKENTNWFVYIKLVIFFIALFLIGCISSNVFAAGEIIDYGDGNTFYTGNRNPGSWKGVGKVVKEYTTNPAEYGYGIYPTKDTTVEWNYAGVVVQEESSYTRYYMYPKNNKSGDIKAYITNAGFYRDGDEIKRTDCVVTFYWNSYTQNGVEIRPYIAFTNNFGDNRLGFNFWTCAYRMHFQLYEHGTNFKTKIKSNTTIMLSDIDGAQFFGLKTNEGSMNTYTTQQTEVWAKKQGGYTWVYAPGNGNSKDIHMYSLASVAFTLKKSGSFDLIVGPNADMSGASGFTNNANGPLMSAYQGNYTRMSSLATLLDKAFKNSGKNSTQLTQRLHEIGDTMGYGICYLGLESCFYGTTMPTITKSAFQSGNGEVVIPENKLRYKQHNFKYSLFINLPSQLRYSGSLGEWDFGFNRFAISDRLPDYVVYKSYKVINLNTGADVSTWFDSIGLGTNNLVLAAKSATLSSKTRLDMKVLRVDIEVELNRPNIYGLLTPGADKYYSWDNRGSLDITYTEMGEISYDGNSAGDVLVSQNMSSKDKSLNSNWVTVKWPSVSNNLLITKKDEVSGVSRTMTGAVFKAIEWNDARNSYVGPEHNAVDNRNGTYSINGLKPSATNIDGKFSIKEVSPPGAHRLDPTPTKPFVVDGDGPGVYQRGETFINPFDYYKIWLNKLDYDDKSIQLTGEFYVVAMNANGSWDFARMTRMSYDSGSKQYYLSVHPDKTNKGKFMVIERIPQSKYQYVTDPRLGYKIGKYDGITHCVLRTFTVDTTSTTKVEDNTEERKAYNEEKPTLGELELKKTDIENGNPTSGAVFSVFQWDSEHDQWDGYNTTTHKVTGDPVDILKWDSAENVYKSDKKLEAIYKHVVNYEKPYGTRMRNDGRFLVVETKQPDGYLFPDDVLTEGYYEKELQVTEDTDTERDDVLPINSFTYDGEKAGFQYDEKLNVTNTPNHLIIEKKNRDGTPLAGVKFIFGPSQNNTREYTTNDDGIIDIRTIAPGSYVYSEYSTLDGYHRESKWYTIKVTSKGEIFNGDIYPGSDDGNRQQYAPHVYKENDRITIETIKQDPGHKTWKYTLHWINDHEQELELIKRDTDDPTADSRGQDVDETREEDVTGRDGKKYNHALKPWEEEPKFWAEEARFLLYEGVGGEGSTAYAETPLATLRYDNVEKMRFVDNTTMRPFKLVWNKENQGRFYIVETRPPEGFILDPNKHYFTITAVPAENEGRKDVEISNMPNALTIEKVDPEGRMLNFAKFAMWRKGGENEIRELAVDATGRGTMKYLEPGTWYYYEKEAPAGYAIDDEVYQFTVGNDGKIEGENAKTIQAVNRHKANLDIIKKDAKTGEDWAPDSDFPEGTEFYIYEWDKEKGDYSDTPSIHVIRSSDGRMTITAPEGTTGITIKNEAMETVASFDTIPESGQVTTGVIPYGTYTVTYTIGGNETTETFLFKGNNANMTIAAPTPEPTPEPTGTPTPEPTPEPTGTPTPEPTPEP